MSPRRRYRIGPLVAVAALLVMAGLASLPGGLWPASEEAAQGADPAGGPSAPPSQISQVGALLSGTAYAQPGRDPFLHLRREMVREQIQNRGVETEEVLLAMEDVPRHLFVPPEYRDLAYKDEPVPIGWGQSVYQPYMVAFMTELLGLDDRDKVLEIGTGSGYHSAVLANVAAEVFTIEINEKLCRTARRTLSALSYEKVRVRCGDGYLGWPDQAPFDAIILTAAPPRIPSPLTEQLKVGGRMVVPVGGFLQDLLVLTKTEDGLEKRRVAPVRLPEMTGEVQKQR